ncbi:MAG: hypothetical protein ABGW50_01600 [Thermococcus sp.]
MGMDVLCFEKLRFCALFIPTWEEPLERIDVYIESKLPHTFIIDPYTNMKMVLVQDDRRIHVAAFESPFPSITVADLVYAYRELVKHGALSLYREALRMMFIGALFSGIARSHTHKLIPKRLWFDINYRTRAIVLPDISEFFYYEKAKHSNDMLEVDLKAAVEVGREMMRTHDIAIEDFDEMAEELGTERVFKLSV